MKTKMKRLLSFVLGLALVITLMPVQMAVKAAGTSIPVLKEGVKTAFSYIDEDEDGSVYTYAGRFSFTASKTGMYIFTLSGVQPDEYENDEDFWFGLRTSNDEYVCRGRITDVSWEEGSPSELEYVAFLEMGKEYIVKCSDNKKGKSITANLSMELKEEFTADNNGLSKKILNDNTLYKVTIKKPGYYGFNFGYMSEDSKHAVVYDVSEYCNSVAESSLTNVAITEETTYYIQVEEGFVFSIDYKSAFEDITLGKVYTLDEDSTVYYTFTPDTTGDYVVKNNNSECRIYDFKENHLLCWGDDTRIVELTEGENYVIRVYGWDGDTRDFCLNRLTVRSIDLGENTVDVASSASVFKYTNLSNTTKMYKVDVEDSDVNCIQTSIQKLGKTEKSENYEDIFSLEKGDTIYIYLSAKTNKETKLYVREVAYKSDIVLEKENVVTGISNNNINYYMVKNIKPYGYYFNVWGATTNTILYYGYDLNNLKTYNFENSSAALYMDLLPKDMYFMLYEKDGRRVDYQVRIDKKADVGQTVTMGENTIDMSEGFKYITFTAPTTDVYYFSGDGDNVVLPDVDDGKIFCEFTYGYDIVSKDGIPFIQSFEDDRQYEENVTDDGTLSDYVYGGYIKLEKGKTYTFYIKDCDYSSAKKLNVGYVDSLKNTNIKKSNGYQAYVYYTYTADKTGYIDIQAKSADEKTKYYTCIYEYDTDKFVENKLVENGKKYLIYISSGWEKALSNPFTVEVDVDSSKYDKEQANIAATNAVKAIKAIGKVSLSSKTLIDKARATYNALSADAKKLVPAADLAILTAAEKTYAELKAAEDAKKPEVKPEPKPEVKPTPSTDLKVGATTKTSTANYKVTKAGELAYVAPVNKNKTSVTIPATVKVNGKTYKVTSIAANAFKNNTKLKKVKIGANVKTIGKNAFVGCKKLSSVTLGKKVATIGVSAFAKCVALTKITIPANVKTIGKNAFSGCSKLKTVTISTKKLTTKTVGKGAFAKINASAKIKVPSTKLNAYKKLLKSKGVSGKKQKITK